MNNKTTPRDFFLHLGATVALYVAAGALINLSFSVINYFRPDALAGYFYGNSVAWPISMLIVLVPILYILEWLINRDISQIPEKADLWIRKWRSYLTVFLAIVLVGGDLIALINVYLNGEITSRFVYKIIVVLLVGGAIGKYYFFSIFNTHKWAKASRRFNAWFGIVLVLAAIITGFIAFGSPTKQRAIRFDNQRISDLNNIQWQIINYWQQKGKVPTALADVADPLSGFVLPTDPEDGSAYEYSQGTTTRSFQLCTTFSEVTQDNKGRGSSNGGIIGYPRYDTSMPYPGGVEDNWSHLAGRTCFSRTIDPDRYPINKPLQKI